MSGERNYSGLTFSIIDNGSSGYEIRVLFSFFANLDRANHRQLRITHEKNEDQGIVGNDPG